MRVAITQKTSLEAVGYPPAAFLRTVNRYGIRHSRVGKVVSVLVSDWEAFLRTHQVKVEEAEGTDVDSILARAGYRRAS